MDESMRDLVEAALFDPLSPPPLSPRWPARTHAKIESTVFGVEKLDIELLERRARGYVKSLLRGDQSGVVSGPGKAGEGELHIAWQCRARLMRCIQTLIWRFRSAEWWAPPTRVRRRGWGRVRAGWTTAPLYCPSRRPCSFAGHPRACGRQRPEA
jgi:hypothetical protein